ncbi:hypothetical protein [Gemmiger formicilis]|uniref:hypothetical protein n=1 Tax=Gemmiger formicilis TaxID=745368 RepID=UPI003994863A
MNVTTARRGPAVLELLQKTNFDQTPAMARMNTAPRPLRQIRSLCDAPTPTCTFSSVRPQANLTVIAAALKPWQGVLCADSGHIHVHETGASRGHRPQVPGPAQ